MERGNVIVRQIVQHILSTESRGRASPREVEALFQIFSKEENSEMVVENGGLEELLAQLETNISSRVLSMHVLGCLWNFAMIPGHSLILCLQGGLTAISQAMKHHETYAQLHARALTALYHVVSTTEYMEDIHTESIVSSVLFGLQRFGNDRYVCDVGFGTLSCILEKAQTAPSHLVHQNAIPLMVSILNRLIDTCSGHHEDSAEPAKTVRRLSLPIAVSIPTSTIGHCNSSPTSPTNQSSPMLKSPVNCAAMSSPTARHPHSYFAPKAATPSLEMSSFSINESELSHHHSNPGSILVCGCGIHDDSTSISENCEELLFKVLHCIFQLTCSDEAKHILCAHRAPRCLVSCLERFPDCERVSLATCGALWNLAMLEKNRSAMGHVGCVEALLKVMTNCIQRTNHSQRAKLVLRASTALYHLTRFHEGNLNIMVGCGGCSTVVNTAREFHNESSVLQMLSLLLLRLSGRHSLELLRNGVIDVSLQILEQHMDTEAICSNCCGLIWNLSIIKDSNNRNPKAEIGQKGVHLLLESIRRHPQHTEILTRAFTALWNLLDLEENVWSFNSGKGLEAALKVINEMQNEMNIVLLVMGCIFLIVFRPTCVALRERFIQLGAVETILHALQIEDHLRNVKFCEKSFELLLRFSIGGAHRISNHNGIPLLLSGMAYHSNNERVVGAACGSIWNLAMHDGCRSLLVHHQVVNKLTEAMTAYPTNVVIQQRAVTALFKLSTTVPNDIVSAGGVKCMMQACQVHRKEKHLVSNVLGTLWNIAMVSDANRLIVGQHIGEILTSMESHPLHLEVQHRGATLLFHLFQNPRNCQSFVSKAMCGNTNLGLRVLFGILRTLCDDKAPNGDHSETIYLSLTCLSLLLKDNRVSNQILLEILPHTTRRNSGDNNTVNDLMPNNIIDSIYLVGLRRCFSTFQNNTRISSRCAQILFWLAQPENSYLLLPWLTADPSPTLLKVLIGIIQNTTLDSTRCNIIDALADIASKVDDQNIHELRSNQELFSIMTSQLVSTYPHVRIKARRLLQYIAPQHYDVLSHPQLDRLLVTSQRTFVFNDSSLTLEENQSEKCEDNLVLSTEIREVTETEKRTPEIRVTSLRPATRIDSIQIDEDEPRFPLSPITEPIIPQVESPSYALDPDQPSNGEYYHVETTLRLACKEMVPMYVDSNYSSTTNTTETSERSSNNNDSSQSQTANMRSNDMCTVCLEEYISGDEITEVVCGHRFHKHCIEHWLQGSFLCPCCRMPVTAMLSNEEFIDRLRAKIMNLPADHNDAVINNSE